MNTSRHTKNVKAFLILCSGLTAGAAFAEELPEARTLIDRHIEAVGGRDAILAQTESVTVAEFAMPVAGVTGRMLAASRADGARVTLIELPGVGEIRSGYSRGGSWSIDPFMGPRLIEGDELAALIERSETRAILRDEEFVRSARTLERTAFDGQACYRVELNWRSGRTSHDCYAVDSGLMIAMESVETSPMGDVESLTLLGEYQDMNGMLVPTVTRVRAMGQDQVLTVKEQRLETPDEALFTLPPSIQTLLTDQ